MATDVHLDWKNLASFGPGDATATIFVLEIELQFFRKGEPRHPQLSWKAIIDTGFNGGLVLPRILKNSLGHLRYTGEYCNLLPIGKRDPDRSPKYAVKYRIEGIEEDLFSDRATFYDLPSFGSRVDESRNSPIIVGMAVLERFKLCSDGSTRTFSLSLV